jgi:ABC-type polysaccharide/polyol phosphate transport system ATPase subunit
VSAASAQGVAVRFTGVSKRFPLNAHRHRSYSELLQRLVGRRPQREYFWPLQNVTVEIPRGRTTGIVGENGAGKSTLLKLVAGIIEPTEGEVVVNGRVSALLELGAGFHPELTGRENIYLNGSVLGIGRATMERLYDSIVRFADIGPFIDIPVKNYSSGMYARLGFAIAINVNPDILLVDEVLAVGDEEFQRRCLNAIRELQARGKTIIVVSHSLAQIVELCDHGLWIHDSEVRATGDIDGVVRRYMQWVAAEQARELLETQGEDAPSAVNSERPRRVGSGPIRITRVRMLDGRGVPSWSVSPGERVSIELDYESGEAVADPVFSVLIHKPDGHYLWASNTVDHRVPFAKLPGRGRLRVEVPVLNLAAGSYRLSAAAYAYPDPPYWSNPSDFHEWLYSFEVVSDTEIHGDVLMPSEWHSAQPAVEAAPRLAMAGEPSQE